MHTRADLAATCAWFEIAARLPSASVFTVVAGMYRSGGKGDHGPPLAPPRLPHASADELLRFCVLDPLQQQVPAIEHLLDSVWSILGQAHSVFFHDRHSSRGSAGDCSHRALQIARPHALRIRSSRIETSALHDNSAGHVCAHACSLWPARGARAGPGRAQVAAADRALLRQLRAGGALRRQLQQLRGLFLLEAPAACDLAGALGSPRLPCGPQRTAPSDTRCCLRTRCPASR